MRSDVQIETLGRRVRERRTSLGLTLQQVATRSGMSPGYLEYVESRQGHPSAGVVRRIADALHTTVEHLYGQGVLEPGAGFSPSSEADVAAATIRPVVSTLTESECLLLLGSVPIGRVAFSVSGPPLVMPVNFTLMGRDVVIQTAAGSALANRARAQRLISFEVDDIDEPSRLGWSVLCHGPVRISTEHGGQDHNAGELVRPWFGDDRRTVIVLTPTAITGRRIGIA